MKNDVKEIHGILLKKLKELKINERNENETSKEDATTKNSSNDNKQKTYDGIKAFEKLYNLYLEELRIKKQDSLVKHIIWAVVILVIVFVFYKNFSCFRLNIFNSI